MVTFSHTSLSWSHPHFWLTLALALTLSWACLNLQIPKCKFKMKDKQSHFGIRPIILFQPAFTRKSRIGVRFFFSTLLTLWYPSMYVHQPECQRRGERGEWHPNSKEGMCLGTITNITLTCASLLLQAFYTTDLKRSSLAIATLITIKKSHSYQLMTTFYNGRYWTGQFANIVFNSNINSSKQVLFLFYRLVNRG